jgi:hypothetical protein
MNDLRVTANRIAELLDKLTHDAGFNLSHTVRTSPSLPYLRIIFEGSDCHLLTEDDGALMTAISHVIFQALALGHEDRNAIYFDLIHDEADLSWEFSRTVGSCVATAREATQIAVLPQIDQLPPERYNADCVTDALWNELVEFRALGGLTLN